MKRKFMAVFLAFAMVVQPIGTGSWNVTEVQAAEQATLIVGENSIDSTADAEDQIRIYTFVPDQTGFYTWGFASGVKNVGIPSYTPTATKIPEEGTKGYVLKAGTEYTLRLKNTNADAATFLITKVRDVKSSEDASIMITKEPSGIQAKAAEKVSVSVTAAGENLQYQWQISSDGNEWKDIKAATGAKYSFVADTSVNGNKMRCVIKSETASLTSEVIDVQIEAIAEDHKLVEGENSSVLMKDVYQFTPKETAYYSFGCEEHITVSGVSSSKGEPKKEEDKYLLEGGVDYFIVLQSELSETTSGTVTITSSKVSISEGGSIIIASEPKDTTVNELETASFSVSVVSEEDVSYQWEKSENGSEEWTAIANATSAKYSFSVRGKVNKSKYRCVITAGDDRITSEAATLSVTSLKILYAGSNTIELEDGRNTINTFRFVPEKTAAYTFTIDPASINSITDENGSDAFTCNGKYILTAGKYYYIKTYASGSSAISLECTIASEDMAISEDGKVVIAEHPQDITVDEGTYSATMSITYRTNGANSYSLQWQCKKSEAAEWENIKNATGRSLEIRNVSGNKNGYQYRCVILSDNQDVLVSNPATLTVSKYEELKVGTNSTVSPEDQTDKHYGFTAEKTGLYTFELDAEAGSVSQVFLVSDSGTSSVYDMHGSGYYLQEGAYYWVYIRYNSEGLNADIEVTERDVTASKDGSLVITSQPVDVTVREFETVNLSIRIYNDDYYSYTWQWQYLEKGSEEWKDYDSSYSDNQDLPLTAKMAMDGWKFRCVITKNDEMIISDEAAVTVKEVPLLQPGENRVTTGSTYKVLPEVSTFFKVTCDEENIFVKDEKGNTIYKRNDGYLRPAKMPMYITIGSYDEESSEVTLTLEESVEGVSENGSFMITSQPETVTCTEGETARFLVGTSGDGDLAYQWQYLEKDGTVWKDLPEETESELSVSSIYERNGYSYRCIIKMTDESEETAAVTDQAVSHAALLTVEKLPELTSGDNRITVLEESYKYYTFTVPKTGAYRFGFGTEDENDFSYSMYTMEGTYVVSLDSNVFLMREGTTYRIRIYNDGSTETATFCISNLETQLSFSDHMFYRYKDEESSLDIRGWSEDGLIMTTYSNGGYYTFIKEVTEENASNITTEGCKRLAFQGNDIPEKSENEYFSVTPNVRFSENGMYTVVSYTIKNLTDSEKTFSLGVNCDVDVDDDDHAIVKVTDTGLSMTSEKGKTYYLVCNNVEGITDADAMWFGEYCTRDEFLFSDYQSIESDGYDSELAVSWQNRKLAAGEEVTITYELGIGDVQVIEAPEDSVIASGICGEALRWTLNGGGVLSIRGTGAMYDYEQGTAPWYEHADKIKSIKIGYGITSIGNYAFYNLLNLEKASISASVETFGEKSIGYTEDGKNENLIIEAYEGTKAQEYAEQNEMQVENLGELGANHVHSYVDESEVVPATCYAAGSKKVVCSGCGDVQTIEIPKTAHNYVTQVVVQTCTEQGYTLHTCINDGCTEEAELHSYKDTYVDATGHVPGEKKNVSMFYTGDVYCEKCGELLEKGTDVVVDLTKSTITLDKNSVTFSGKMTLPVVTVMYEGEKVPSTDYTVAYTNSKNAGTATITVTGTNRCTGTITKNFTIEKQSIKGLKFKLAKSTFTCTGKELKPAVSVSGLKANTDFTVSYKNNKTPGAATVTITGKGNYTGTATLSFTITPKGTSISKVKAGKKRFVASWKAQKSNTDGYEIRYSLKKNMFGAKTVKISKNKTTSTTVKKLKSKKTYYVQVRTYKKGKVNNKNKVFYSEWSKAKTVKAK